MICLTVSLNQFSSIKRLSLHFRTPRSSSLIIQVHRPRIFPIKLSFLGQAFTAYDPSVLQTNEDIATILDILINLLLDTDRITELDKIFLLGIGYGGNIASCFCKFF